MRHLVLLIILCLSGSALGQEKESHGMYTSLAYQGTESLVILFFPLDKLDCRQSQMYLDTTVKEELHRMFKSQNPEITSSIDENAFVAATAQEFRYSCIELFGLKPDPSYSFRLRDGLQGSYYLERLGPDRYEIGSVDKESCKKKEATSMLLGKYYQCFMTNQSLYSF